MSEVSSHKTGELEKSECVWEMESARFIEKTYRVVFERLRIGIILINGNGVALYCNPYFANIFGVRREQYLGLNLLERLPEGPVRNTLVDVLADRGVQEYEGPYFSIFSGKKLDLHICTEKVAPDLILGIFEDITSRRQAEEDLRINTARLEEAQKMARVGNWEYDVVTGKIWGSDQAFKMYGLKPTEKNQLDLAEVEACVVERERVNQALVDLIQRGKSYDIEIAINPADGGPPRVMHSIGDCIRDDNGNPVRVVGVVQDITERKRMEAENQRLQDQLSQAQKLESVGRLAGGVAHDFNNMLSVIIGRAELALMGLQSSDPLYKDLHEIEKMGKRSADLTRQLLAFARKQTIAPRLLNLNETIESMLKMLRQLIGEDINLKWKPATDLWTIKMDPAQIDQILANLVVNARDAIQDIGTVMIQTENILLTEADCYSNVGFLKGQYAMLSVSDDGCGMEPEILGNIFEPFFTTKSAGSGTGLGLATVYGIIKQNKGFIQVLSEPGKGSTFRIYLPRYAEKIAAIVGEDSGETAMGGPETILLVEDEPAILEVTQTMLQKLGYRTLAAATPGEAVRLAEEHSGEIHLLMTDVVMPEMNGRDLAKRLLSLYPQIKRLFVSGYTADIIAHHGVLEEGVHFIQKPFAMKDLADRVRKALA